MTVPKIEVTARTIRRPIVRRREERASRREETKFFSVFPDTGDPRKKLALSFAQRQQKDLRKLG
jgi:hypothetical protein